MEKIQVSGKVNIFLQLIPYTAMASLIFPAILYVDKNIWIGMGTYSICSKVLYIKGNK